jgi:biotin operon repressor
MRRTDRLFDLIQILRDGRLHTARDMAERLEVSTRTLWRDMATLIASGLPVEGERGVGYILREPITMPPLTLTPDELPALTLGLQLVSRGADPSLTRAAESLLGKVSAVLPARLLDGVGTETWVFPGDEALAAARPLPTLRRAIRPDVDLANRTHRVVQNELLQPPGFLGSLGLIAHLRGHAGDRAQRLAPGQWRADVDRNHHIRPQAARHVHWQVVDQATVAQDAAVQFQRTVGSSKSAAISTKVTPDTALLQTISASGS